MNALTDDLIDAIAQRGANVPQATAPVFAIPLAAAGLACLLSLLLVLGLPAGVAANPLPSLLAKWVVTLSLTGSALNALWSLVHPGRPSTVPLLLPLIPIACTAGVSLLEATGSLHGLRAASGLTCALAMALGGLVTFAAAIYAARQFAPVHQRRAGAAAGLLAGGIAATAYAPFCPEVSALFVTVFYFGPTLVLAAIGWLTGPIILRW